MTERISSWSNEWTNVRRLQEQIDLTSATARTTEQDVRDLRAELDRLQRKVAALEDRSSDNDAKARLNEFDPARRVREAALVAIDGLVSGEPLPVDLDFGSLADERGYWLAPLVRMLPGLLAGQPDPRLLEQARQRDPLRTATFLAVLAFLRADPAVATAWLPGALASGMLTSGTPGLTAAVRVLWLACDRTGIENVFLRQAAESAVETATAQDHLDLVEHLRTHTPGLEAGPATGALERLKAWADFGDLLATSVGADSPGGTPGLLGAVLQSMVLEGSEPERPLLDRLDEHRARRIDLHTGSLLSWNEPAGPVLLLAAADLDGARPRRARRALTMIRPEVLTVIDELAAAAAEVPDAVSMVRVGNLDLAVTAAGPQDPDRLARSVSGPPRSRPFLNGITISCGWLVILGVAVLAVWQGPAWWVLVAVLAFSLIAGTVTVNKSERQAATDLQSRRTEAKAIVQDAMKSAAEKGRLARQAAADGRLLAARARAALAADGPPVGVEPGAALKLS